MKTISPLFLFLIIVPIWLNAQPDESEPTISVEKIKAEKVAYITNELDLTVKEAQQFWPVYNEMEAKMDELRSKEREIHRKMKKGIDELSDQELEKLIDEQMSVQLKAAEIEKEYYNEFKKVLPIKKVCMLQHAEKEFMHKLLRQLKGKGMHGSGPGPKTGCFMNEYLD
ncbi:MAG: hypothetical protein ABIJ16_01750 [Bacteroidota bacterium]